MPTQGLKIVEYEPCIDVPTISSADTTGTAESLSTAALICVQSTSEVYSRIPQGPDICDTAFLRDLGLHQHKASPEYGLQTFHRISALIGDCE